MGIFWGLWRNRVNNVATIHPRLLANLYNLSDFSVHEETSVKNDLEK